MINLYNKNKYYNNKKLQKIIYHRIYNKILKMMKKNNKNKVI